MSTSTDSPDTPNGRVLALAAVMMSANASARAWVAVRVSPVLRGR